MEANEFCKKYTESKSDFKDIWEPFQGIIEMIGSSCVKPRTRVEGSFFCYP